MRTSLVLIVKRKGATLVYAKSSGDVMQVAREPVDAELAVTYDEEERRLPVTGKLSYHEAFRMFRRETGRRMAVLNASSDTGVIYGVDEEVASSFPTRTLPLTYLVDRLLASNPSSNEGQPLLVAVFLGEANRPAVPLLLIGVNADRTVALQDPVPSVADFSTTVANVLGAMTSAGTLRGLDFDPRLASRSDEVKSRLAAFLDSRVVVRTLFDLVPLAAGAREYPREPLYRGVRVSALTRATLVISAGALASAVSAAGVAEWTRQTAISERTALERNLAEQRGQVQADLLRRMTGLALKVSLQPSTLFAAADTLAGSRGNVSLVATLEGSVLALEVPRRGTTTSDHGAALARIEPEALIRALRVSAPPGWSRQSLETSGDLNAWTLRFARASLERDLLDLVGGGEPSGPPALGSGGFGEGRAAGVSRASAVRGR